MQLASYRISEKIGTEELATSPDAAWARFGDELLIYSDKAQPEKLGLPQERSAGQVSERQLPLRREELYVVVQNGRMFQKEHPEVPVLLDKGRYLLTHLDPQEADQLKDSSPTCYGLFQLQENQVVFDVRDSAAARVARVDWIQERVNRVERASFESFLTSLVAFQTRQSLSAGFKQAVSWAREQLKNMGYTVTVKSISVNGSPSRNIVADKKGLGTGPRKVVVITAHLDSINIAGGPAAAAPGADDNGSGSAGALEMARVFSDHPSKHDMRFILFGGEEQGLFGSKQYVASLSPTEKQRILSVLNMDMIGSLNAPTRSVMLEGAPLSQTLIDSLSEAAATYTELRVETSLNPFASDHVPFINANIPAVLTIEGADSTNGNIHSAGDTLNHIDFDFALEILRMNVAFAAGEMGINS